MYTEATLDKEPFLIFSKDNGVSQIIAQNSSFGFAELKIYDDILEDGETFLDIGMNIGAISFQIKKRKPSIRVFGFEPIKEFYNLAVENLSRFDGVNCFNIGIGIKNSIIGLRKFPTDSIANFGSTKLYSSGSEYFVKIQRLDAIPELIGVLPKLVKIDVEGQEDLVLQGMEKLIHDNIYLSIEADRPKTVKKCIEFLKFKKFNIFFGTLAITNRLEKNRNIQYDKLSTPHIFACYKAASPWMARLTKPIGTYDDYCKYIDPIFQRTRENKMRHYQ